MEISRNNYEEFFLMYVDGELSASEEKLVEIFIKENPDLEQELVLFQQSKFLSDPAIVYHDKETLMAQPAGSKLINLTNYEEFFLMYADNELSADEKFAVEKFASQHAKLRKELSYILKCRISPEKDIVFEGKETLLRYESKRRVVYFSRFNIAVAASLILIAGFLLFKFVYNQKTTPVETAKHITPSNKTPDAEKKSLPTVTPSTVNPYNESAARLQALPDRNLADNLPRSSLKKKHDKQTISDVDQLKPESAVIPEKKSISVSTIAGARTNANTNSISSMVVNTGKPVIALNNEQVQNQVDVDQPQDNHQSRQVALVAVPYTEDGISVLTGTTGKSTMRGFFRKVSRVFEKTTRIGDEDEKKAVLVGNFQIALK